MDINEEGRVNKVEHKGIRFADREVNVTRRAYTPQETSLKKESMGVGGENTKALSRDRLAHAHGHNYHLSL